MEQIDFFNLKFVKHALIISGVVVLPLYLYLFLTNANLFHTIMEYSIVSLGFIAATVGIITSFRLKNNYLSKLSPSIIGYNFFLIFHVLSSAGQNIFQNINNDFSASLWLFGNTFLVLGFLFSFLRNSDKNSIILRLIITILFVIVIFIVSYYDLLPALINNGKNTLFYIIWVVLIVLLYLVDIAIWFFKDNIRNNSDYRILGVCLVLLMLSEILLINHFIDNSIWIYIGSSMRFICFLILTYTILRVNMIDPFNFLYQSIYEENILQKKLKEEISQSLRRLSRSQEIGHVGTWELDLETNLIWASDETFRIHGIEITEDNVLDFNSIQNLVDEKDRKRLDTALKGLISGKRGYNVYFSLTTPNGEYRYLHSVATLEYRDKLPAIVYGVVNDMTDLKNEQEKLKWASYHDHLTNVYNRRHFLEQRSALDFDQYLPVSTVILDINGLKVINDSFGHHTGNRVLKSTATILEQNVKEENSFVARIGGDEFAVIYPNTNLSDAEEKIQNIAKIINEEKVGNINLSIAYGLAEKKTSEDSFDEVLKKAEDEMYIHKISNTLSSRNKIIDALLKSLYEKDKMSEEHSKRVSDLSYRLAKAAGLTDKKASDVLVAGLLHDIGKITIANAIVNKEGKITDEEYKIIKTHSEKGYKILHSIGGMDIIANYVLQHHERIDGTGYPRNLDGEDIHLEAKIICIADAYDSMTSIRTYKSVLSKTEAIKELVRCKGTHFDSELVDIFIENVINKKA